MVLLTLTPAAKAATEEYCKLRKCEREDDAEVKERLEKLSKLELGNPIDHNDLIYISGLLVQRSRDEDGENAVAKEWRLDTLLKGALVYQPPSPPKPEHVSFTSLKSNLSGNDFD